MILSLNLFLQNKLPEEKLQYKKKVISRPTKSVGFDD
jgi:hypothetical protein